MPKKKQKTVKSRQKVDITKLQEDARQKHLEESTAVVLQNAPQLQKELTGEWVREAIGIKKQEIMDGLERQLKEHELFLESADDLLMSLKWEIQDTDEALDSAVYTLQQTHSELLSLQQNRIKGLKEFFQSRVQALKTFFLNNISDITETHTKFKRELETLIQLIADEEKQKAAEDVQEASSHFDFTCNRAIENEHQLQSLLDQKIKALKEQIETALQNYRSATEGQTLEYKRLLQQDQSLSTQVNQKIKDVNQMQTAIGHWKNKVAHNKQDFEARNSRIQGEIEQLRKHCKELRDEMEGARVLERQKLKCVSLCARETKEKLMEKLKLADKIHRFAMLCNKYERPEVSEPFQMQQVTEADTSSWTSENQKLHKALKELMLSKGDEWGPLENVFNRISNVALESSCVQMSLKTISCVNETANATIQNFVSSLSVVAEGSSQPPPSLLSVSKIKPTNRTNRSQLRAFTS